MKSNQRRNLNIRLRPDIYVFFCVVLANLCLQRTVGPDLRLGNFGDAGQYLKSAEAIFTKSEYPRILEEWPTFRMPGYPLIIAILWEITSLNSIIAIKVFNAICVGAISVITYRIASRHLVKRFALLAGFLIGLNPFLYLQSTEVSTEVITMTLFLLFVYVITGKNHSYRIFLLACLVVILGFIRPEYFLICLPTLMWSIFRGDKRFINTLIAFVIITTPLHIWGLQNQKATGSYLLSNSGNFQLWMGATETINDNYPLSFADSENFSRDQFLRLKEEINSVEERHSFIQTAGDIDRQSEIWFQEFRSSVLNAPVSYFKNVVYKGLVFWRPFLNPQSYSPIEVFGSLLLLLPSFSATLMGVIVARRNRFFRRELFVYLFSFICLTAIHAIQMPDLRYRVTILEPFSAIMIAVSANALVRVLASRNPRKRDSNP